MIIYQLHGEIMKIRNEGGKLRHLEHSLYSLDFFPIAPLTIRNSLEWFSRNRRVFCASGCSSRAIEIPLNK